jgi:hypothetical protein
MVPIFETIGHGTYGINFFGYSVEHSVETSRRVLAELSGSFAANAHKWQVATRDDKALWLTERHESGHHHLLASTPCGLLLWRLNQVVSRDIAWLMGQCSDLGIRPPSLSAPRQFFNSEEFLKRLSSSDCPRAKALYLINVLANLENCLVVRDVFFGVNAPARHKALTLAKFAKMMNAAFEWMRDWCGIPWTSHWHYRGDGEKHVFPTCGPINALDIAEAHAIAHELSAIRSFQDAQGFHERLRDIQGTRYEIGIKAGSKGLPALPEYPFSAPVVRLRSLLAFSGGVDLSAVPSSGRTLMLENELPWYRFSEGPDSDDIWRTAFETLKFLVEQPVYGPDAKWSKISRLDNIANLDGYAGTLHWLGLDLQVHGFHKNAHSNLEHMMLYIQRNQHPYDVIEKSIANSHYINEYSDFIHMIFLDLQEIYKERWALLRDTMGFDKANRPDIQLMSHLLNGASHRNNIAYYLGEKIPSPTIIEEKFKNALIHAYEQLGVDVQTLSKFADATAPFITRLIENGTFGSGGKAEFLVSESGRFII